MIHAHFPRSGPRVCARGGMPYEGACWIERRLIPKRNYGALFVLQMQFAGEQHFGPAVRHALNPFSTDPTVSGAPACVKASLRCTATSCCSRCGASRPKLVVGRLLLLLTSHRDVTAQTSRLLGANLPDGVRDNEREHHEGPSGLQQHQCLHSRREWHPSTRAKCHGADAGFVEIVDK